MRYFGTLCIALNNLVHCSFDGRPTTLKAMCRPSTRHAGRRLQRICDDRRYPRGVTRCHCRRLSRSWPVRRRLHCRWWMCGRVLRHGLPRTRKIWDRRSVERTCYLFLICLHDAPLLWSNLIPGGIRLWGGVREYSRYLPITILDSLLSPVSLCWGHQGVWSTM